MTATACRIIVSMLTDQILSGFERISQLEAENNPVSRSADFNTLIHGINSARKRFGWFGWI